MGWNTEKCPQKLLEKASEGIPMTIAEIHRMAVASGEEVPNYRRFKQIAADAEAKFREAIGLLDEEPIRQPQPRRRRRIVRN